jgi:transcriptional antiterminator RfaH
MTTKRWYVVQTLPRQEERADENLLRQGYRSWLPRMRRCRRHARRIDSVVVPLFPCYLFLQLEIPVQRWRSVNGTFGVIRLLCRGDAPLAAPVGLVEQLMARADESGAVTPAPPPRRFVKGEALKVIDGPFAELEGLFEEMSGPDRVVVLLKLLGRPVRTTVPIGAVAT